MLEIKNMTYNEIDLELKMRLNGQNYQEYCDKKKLFKRIKKEYWKFYLSLKNNFLLLFLLIIIFFIILIFFSIDIIKNYNRS